MKISLDTIQIASPCHAAWDDMAGSDRVRHCNACDKQVFNLSELTRPEATSLLEEHGYTLCVRLYRRADGTILTADCPVGLAARMRKRARRTVLVLASWLGIASLIGCGENASTHPQGKPASSSERLTGECIAGGIGPPVDVEEKHP